MRSRRSLTQGLALCAAILSAMLLAGSCGKVESPPPVKIESAPAAAQKPESAASNAPTASVAPSAPAAVEGAAAGSVHPCAGAGRWFPADPEKLGRLVDSYLMAQPPSIPRPPVALIVPHAGYEFSGPVAGKAYATLKGRTYKRVILLALSHQVPLRGASVLKVDAYETPLGRIPIDTAARDALLKCPVVKEVAAAHRTEHSDENQLPMLQRALGPFKLVDVLVCDMAPDQRAMLADAIRPLADDATLIVASSDFTHYGPNYGYLGLPGQAISRDRAPELLQRLNDAAVGEILEIDVPGWDTYLDQTQDTICGRAGIGLLLKILEPWDDVRAARVAYDTSGQITGDFTNSVTYAAIAFWRAGEGLTKAEQATLLRLARDTVTLYLKSGDHLKADPTKYALTAALRAPGAVFVTLKNRGELRGCIGSVVAHELLYESVINNACNACLDPRFTDNRITSKEAPALSIEISVLSPMRRFSDLTKIEIGRDGLMMGLGRNRGLFLPQVPGEQGWNREQYLTNLCHKAGLPESALKDPKTEFYKFTAQVFGEHEVAAK
ncbi:MAG: AmmeMemoRadiSam system protein B [Planctomycetota bacterium]|nr:AmmeMemoRadiSam system protein B [Planctomycetota bacterium]